MTGQPRRLGPKDAEAITRLGGSGDLLVHDYTRAFGLDDENGALTAFIMVQIAADEADIVDIATDPRRRRTGLARMLVRHTMAHLRSLGVATLHLDVSQDNASARNLYESLGFVVVGRRTGYYRKQDQPAEDALLMSLAIWRLSTED